MARKNPMGILYELSFPSGKRYIGVTVSGLRRRIALHVSSSKKKTYPLSRAIVKYGRDRMESKVLVVAKQDYLLELEVAAIERFNTRAPNGYNLSYGGDAVFSGRHHTKTSRSLMSKTVKDHYVNHHWGLPTQRKLRSDNKSGFTGVTYQTRRTGSWRAYIYFEGEHIILGHFKTKSEAVACRKAAEKKYYGEFASHHRSK